MPFQISQYCKWQSPPGERQKGKWYHDFTRHFHDFKGIVVYFFEIFIVSVDIMNFIWNQNKIETVGI